MRWLPGFALLPLTLLCSGCALQAPDATSLTAGPALQGTVHGGQQPVSGARIYLLAASTAGYGQPSSSLLNSSLFPSDSIGAYTTSDANGNFSITGDYLCTPKTQVYLYARGGNPGGGTNGDIGLMAALGSCPASQTFAASVPFLVINEVTTVAAAYALAGFATDPTHVASSGTTLAQTGISNAFLNAANLANIVNGSALLTTPTGNGTAPQARVNTLANILAACINTNPGTATTCSTLFTNAQATGVSPTDTAAAAINIAHNPGANIATLYGLVSSTAPFGPALTTQPSDFTLPITYTGARLTSFPGNFPYGQTTSLAIDAYGNVFTTDPALGATGINKFSSTGEDLSSPSTFVGNSTDSPNLVVIGPNNNVWVLNGAQNYNSLDTLAQFSNSGTLLSGAGYSGGAFTVRDGNETFAFDPSGNAVVTTSSTLVRFNSSGQLDPPAVAYPTLGGIGSLALSPAGDAWLDASFSNKAGLYEILPTGAIAPGSPFIGGPNLPGISNLAIDAGNNIWGIGSSPNRSINGFPVQLIGVFNSAGQSVFPSGITYPGVNDPTFLSLDGVGTAFVSDFNTFGNGSQIARIVASGSTLVSTAVYGTGFLNTVYSNSALDGSGNLWVTDFLESTPEFSDGRLIQFVGLAAPVVTPLAAGVANGTLATRP